jgi:pectate lyase
VTALTFICSALDSRHRSKLAASLVVGLALLQPILGCEDYSVPAFPGAEGFGAFSAGGRKGRVIEVTNLDDVDSSGNTVPGSLRAAIEASGPRTVVFRVGGTINVCETNRALVISRPYITIAGQTAPGGGIALRLDPSCASSTLTIETHDVILRHLRLRPGVTPAIGDNGDALTVAGPNVHDIMIDHCSLSWATDEDLDTSWGANNVTVQYSIISEALLNAPRAAGPSGGYGMLIAEGGNNQTGRITVHHNLFAHNYYRNPQITIGGLVDFRNNVIYDWGLHGLRLMDLYGPPRINIVGNFAKAGPTATTTTSVREMWAYHSIGYAPFSYFVQDNLGPRRPSSSEPDLDIIYCREHYEDVSNSGIDCDPSAYATYTVFPASPVTTTSSTIAYDTVLQEAGATLPLRDSVDARIVKDVKNGTGGDIADPSEVGGWPSLASGTPALDSDHDGMPDWWELQYHLNPYDASDASLDADLDGYTNLEEFLNSTDPLVSDR